MVDSSQIPSDIRRLMSEPHFPLGHVLLQNADVFRALGLEMPLDQRLGQGSFGTVYQTHIGGGSALKLTRDVSEAQAACLLRGRQSKRIVHVHDVWAVPGTFDGDLRGWYLVHRELLSPLGAKDAIAANVIFQLYNDDIIDLSLPRSMRQRAMVNRWRSHIHDFVMNDMGGGGVSVSDEGDMVFTNGGQITKRALQLLLQIGSAVAEMHSAGIDWEDIHPDNLMRNAGGRLVIGDIGYGVMHEDFSDEVPFITFEEAVAYRARATTAASPSESLQSPHPS